MLNSSFSGAILSRMEYRMKILFLIIKIATENLKNTTEQRLVDRSLTDEEKKARKKADRERKRQEARDAAEKKKRFGLTPEKKRKLRLLIMKMATENLKGEQQRRLEARKNYIEQHLKPLDNLSSMSDAQLKSLCQELHSQLKSHEESRYDLEFKIRKQDYDVNELTIKINDIKGKFVKPSLKKVSKTEQKLNKIKKPKEDEPNFLNMANLKQSTNKFALKEEQEEEKINYRDQVQLKSAKEHKEEEA
ncbi:unnamed protein product [Rotaria sordida]|uniref:Troponin I n=1 Tax=Rotaria sordida TaxID=392033 RepID=A0A818XBG5_9BILA|nr:unnamed protein product [Rotaria sordida]